MASGDVGDEASRSRTATPPTVGAGSSFTSSLSPSPSLCRNSTNEIFHSHMDASEINMQMFKMPVSNVAKRLAILDQEESYAKKKKPLFLDSKRFPLGSVLK